MADDKKIPGQHEQAPPAAPGKPEATVPVTENSGQVTLDGTTTPAGTDKPKTNPPDKEAPAGEQKTEPKKNDGKVIDITGKAGVHTEPVKKPAAPAKADKAEKQGKAKPASKSPPVKVDKGASDKAGSHEDKVSQSEKGDKSPKKTAGGVGKPAAESKVKNPQPSVPAPKKEKTVILKLSEVHPFHTFREHPFKVKDDGKMAELAASIKENGVLLPGLVRPEKDGSGYELVAGHRRAFGSQKAGLEEMPFIVREMTDHEAVQAMKDSNKQRDHTLPSELAALLDLEVEDIKHQGGRLKNVAEGDIGKRSVEIVGEAHGMNYKKVMRYLRLNSLVPELLNMVDEKRMGFMPAVELSYIRPKNQRLIGVSIEGEQSSPSVAQAKRLRELDQAGKLTGDVIDGILSEEKKEVDRVIITTDELNKYFGKEVTPRQMKDQIMALLDDWKEKQPPEKKAPEQSAERS